MATPHDFDLLLYLAPILLCLFAAFALVVNHKATVPQKWLALCLTMLGATMSFTFCYDRYFNDTLRRWLLPAYFVMSIFTAILVLFYFMSLMQPARLTRRYKLTFVAAAIVYAAVMYMPLMAGWHTDEDRALFRLLGVACDASLITYTITAVTVMYFRYRRFIGDTYSYGEGINLRWIFVSNGALALLGVGDIIWKLRGDIDESSFFNFISLVVIAIVFWLGSRQGEVPAVPPRAAQDTAQDAATADRLSVIQPSLRQKQTRQALLDYFRDQKPYLDAELSLDQVAQAIGAKNGYLSRLINREFNINFYTFVNTYRIDYAVGLIDRRGGGIGIVELYTSSGFKSRSVFYSQFLRSTGHTPMEAIRASAAREAGR